MDATEIATLIAIWVFGSALWDYILFTYYPNWIPANRNYTEKRGWRC